ncbi:helix-turn-helix transcriptional regulator [Enterococcus faecalis]|uniref:helix-turn-helix transcriptional regulator n=1 Tax=Enterococcus faecalis TaxID=1351 RepID=UPI003D0B2904
MDKETQHEILKNRILSYLKKENLSINRLAELSNIRQSTLNNIINRGTIPRIDTIQSICEGLNISVKDFFDFEPYNLTPKITDNNPEELMNYLKHLSEEISKIEKKLQENNFGEK